MKRRSCRLALTWKPLGFPHRATGWENCSRPTRVSTESTQVRSCPAAAESWLSKGVGQIEVLAIRYRPPWAQLSDLSSHGSILVFSEAPLLPLSPQGLPLIPCAGSWIRKTTCALRLPCKCSTAALPADLVTDLSSSSCRLTMRMLSKSATGRW